MRNPWLDRKIVVTTYEHRACCERTGQRVEMTDEVVAGTITHPHTNPRCVNSCELHMIDRQVMTNEERVER